MKIGLVVHSNSGHTMKAAEVLRDKLLELGLDVRLERFGAHDESRNTLMQGAGAIRLKSIPDISKYDMTVFCAWVMGGKLSPVMDAYLSKIKSLSGRKTAFLITRFFPFKSWGGIQVKAQIENIMKSMGADFKGMSEVTWMGFGKKSRINRASDEMISMLLEAGKE